VKRAWFGLLFLLALTNVVATEVTTDGRAFESLTAKEIELLGKSDKTAYEAWQATQDAGQSSSTYQQSDGPNTMDLSSDFSM
jgi:hypothetical protein